MPLAKSPIESSALRNRVRRATCLLNAARYDEAIAELELLTGWSSDANSDPLSWFLSSPHSFPDIAELRKAIASDAEDASLHFQLGVRLAAASRLEEAELRFTQALSINRDYADAVLYLGLCRNRNGDLDGAVKLFRRAQALRPDDARVSLILAKTVRSARAVGSIVNVCAAISQD